VRLERSAVERESFKAKHIAFGERADDDLDAVGGTEQHVGDDHRRGDQAAVGADDREWPTADRQARVARAGRVHDAPPLHLPRGHADVRFAPAVHETGAALPAVMGLDPPPRRLDLSILLQLDIVQDQRAIGVEHQLVGCPDDQRAVQTSLQLHGFVEVRVVPERAGVRQAESVDKRLARTDGTLDSLGPVHGSGNTESMPVHDRGLGQVINELNLEDVTNSGFERGTRHGTVEGPGRGHHAWNKFPARLAGFELHGNHLPTRIRLRLRKGLVVRAIAHPIGGVRTTIVMAMIGHGHLARILPFAACGLACARPSPCS